MDSRDTAAVMTPDEMEALHLQAHRAGMAAGTRVVPNPMVVMGMNGQRYYVPDGPCGFAWVTVRPGTSRFARYMVKSGVMSKAYGGGVQLWVGEFGQSIARKEAYARAYAQVLREAGINAVSGSRLD